MGRQYGSLLFAVIFTVIVLLSLAGWHLVARRGLKLCRELIKMILQKNKFKIFTRRKELRRLFFFHISSRSQASQLGELR
jgi:hypothetical protein